LYGVRACVGEQLYSRSRATKTETAQGNTLHSFGANVTIKEITVFGAERVSCDWRK